jgi:hypothetical protein
VTDFADLVPGPGERTVVYGGSRSGKSSYVDWTMRFIQHTRPSAMILLLDTKPRFRAASIAWGPRASYRRDAAFLYEDWAKGPLLPNSVVVPMGADKPLAGLFKRPGEIGILQSGVTAARPVMLRITRQFITMHTGGRERIVVVDEGMDFYQRNTLGVDARNDVLLDIARAGGERTIGLIFAAHRPKGIPPLMNTLSSRVVIYHLRYEDDMRYLWEMGVPEEKSPTGLYVMHHYQVNPGGTVSNPIQARLSLPQWYIDQLAST